MSASSAWASNTRRSGPPFIESECGYPELLETTGWNIVDRIDVTADYEETSRTHIREVDARAEPMSEILGATEVAELLARKRRNVKTIAEGIVRRDLFLVVPG